MHTGFVHPRCRLYELDRLSLDVTITAPNIAVTAWDPKHLVNILYPKFKTLVLGENNCAAHSADLAHCPGSELQIQLVPHWKLSKGIAGDRAEPCRDASSSPSPIPPMLSSAPAPLAPPLLLAGKQLHQPDHRDQIR